MPDIDAGRGEWLLRGLIDDATGDRAPFPGALGPDGRRRTGRECGQTRREHYESTTLPWHVTSWLLSRAHAGHGIRRPAFEPFESTPGGATRRARWDHGCITWGNASLAMVNGHGRRVPWRRDCLTRLSRAADVAFAGALCVTHAIAAAGGAPLTCHHLPIDVCAECGIQDHAIPHRHPSRRIYVLALSRFSARLSLRYPRVHHGRHSRHHSLDELYEVSCKELNTLVSLASQHPGCLGARMTGGGFGGNTINLVHRDSISSFSEFVQKEYQQQCGIACSIMDCVPVEGCIFTEEQSISDNF